MKEEWRDIEKLNYLYQISSLGRIKNIKTGRILKQSLSHNGYKIITIRKNKKRISWIVHRLVAGAFISNPNDYKEINHIDGNKENNNYLNLEWCNRSQNIKHAYKQGLKIAPSGEKNKVSRKVIQYDIKGNFIKEWDCIREVGKQLKINNANIGECCRLKRKTAGGYVWRYV